MWSLVSLILSRSAQLWPKRFESLLLLMISVMTELIEKRKFFIPYEVSTKFQILPTLITQRLFFFKPCCSPSYLERNSKPIKRQVGTCGGAFPYGSFPWIVRLLLVYTYGGIMRCCCCCTGEFYFSPHRPICRLYM